MDIAQTLQALGHAWQYFLDPVYIGWMLAGILVGIIVGVMPAIGVMFALSVFLPFVFFLEAREALPFMMAVMSTSAFGGMITTIVLSVPGDATNICTLMDGPPMAKKGQGARAMGAGIFAGLLGNVYSTILALLMIPVIIPMVMALASAEMVFVVMLGLVMLAALSRESMLKGMVAGFAGMLFGLVGTNLITSTERFTFNSLTLYDGFDIVPVALGLLAVPELVTAMIEGDAGAMVAAKLGGIRQAVDGIKDVFRFWKLHLVAVMVGYIVGIIPGIGGQTASFVSYAQAKQFSKHPERFGTGIVEGVIAPETANKSKEGGDLLTTLALGIPGSAVMTLLMGAFLMLGLVPGPEMLTKHLDLSLSLILIIAVSGLIVAVICFFAAPFLAKIALIPSRIIVPVTLALIYIGTYAGDQRFADLLVLSLFSVIGVAMHLYGFSKASFILGFILSSLFEKYLFISLSAYGPLFFTRPIAMGLFLACIAMAAIPFLKARHMHLPWQRGQAS